MGNTRKTLAVEHAAETVASNTLNYTPFKALRKISCPATVTTVTGGGYGDSLTLQADGGVLTITDATGNISVGGADLTIADGKIVKLLFNGTNWVGIGSSESVEQAEHASDGAVNLVQLSDGSGGFTSDTNFSFASDALNCGTKGILDSATSWFDIRGPLPSSIVALRGSNNTGYSSFFSYGPSQSSNYAGVRMLGGTVNSAIDAAPGDCTVQGVSAGAAATGANRNGGDVFIYGGTSTGGQPEGDVILAYDKTDLRGNVGVGHEAPDEILDVEGHFKSRQDTLPTTDISTTVLDDGGGGGEAWTMTAGSTDSAGSFVITASATGTSGTGLVGTLTFDTAYTAAPKAVILSAKDANAHVVQAYVDNITTTTFDLNIAVTLPGGQSANFYYWIIG